MIAAWMAYALLVAALAAGAAGILEAFLRSHRKPTRWVWLAAVGFASLWPVWTALKPEGVTPAPGSQAGRMVTLEPLALQVSTRSIWHALELPLLVGWVGASLLLVSLGIILLLRTRRLKREWMETRTLGRSVLLSEDWGPAVMGLFRPRIVLPRWCQTMDGDSLTLILDHEEEHLRAGDLPFLILAGIPPLLLPWSLPLWWMWYRLRLAVEGDCDLRVLRNNPRATRAYLKLLLEVGRRLPQHGMAAAMLSEPERTLERRIKIMTMPIPKKPLLRGAILVAVGSILVAVACWAPIPTAVDEAEPSSVTATVTQDQVSDPANVLARKPVFTPYTVRPDIKNRSEIAGALEVNYPPLLRDAGISGTSTVWFLIDENGAVQEARINESSGHQALDDAALRVAEVIEFTPALNGDEAVAVWISLPITFTNR